MHLFLCCSWSYKIIKSFFLNWKPKYFQSYKVHKKEIFFSEGKLHPACDVLVELKRKKQIQRFWRTWFGRTADRKKRTFHKGCFCCSFITEMRLQGMGEEQIFYILILLNIASKENFKVYLLLLWFAVWISVLMLILKEFPSAYTHFSVQ